MLDSLPKILFSASGSKQRYYLQIDYMDNRVRLSYAPFFHEDTRAFGYWVEFGNEEILVKKTQEFIQKWLDEGNAVVRQ